MKTTNTSFLSECRISCGATIQIATIIVFVVLGPVCLTPRSNSMGEGESFILFSETHATSAVGLIPLGNCVYLDVRSQDPWEELFWRGGGGRADALRVRAFSKLSTILLPHFPRKKSGGGATAPGQQHTLIHASYLTFYSVSIH